MDIFDLDINEFENKIDELLENISEEDLLNRLIKNGLEVDIYEDEEVMYYVEDVDNVWIHNNGTSKKKTVRNIFSRNNKINLTEAA